jgi:hypothetical protein
MMPQAFSEADLAQLFAPASKLCVPDELLIELRQQLAILEAREARGAGRLSLQLVLTSAGILAACMVTTGLLYHGLENIKSLETLIPFLPSGGLALLGKLLPVVLAPLFLPLLKHLVDSDE